MSEKSFKLLALGLFVCAACYLNNTRYRTVRDVAYAMDLVSQAYVHPIAQVELKNAAIEGLLESLDPYSSYISEDSLGRFQSVFQQRFAGLGVQVDGPPDRPAITVVATLFNSPAFRAGLQPGDTIVEVDGVDVRNMETSSVSERISGTVGTPVQLGIERQGERLVIQATREFVDVESVTGDRRAKDGTWDFKMQAWPRIAYLHVNIFGEKTAIEVENAIKSLDGQIDAIILDLRDNGGGLLQSAIEVCDLFLEDGRIVSTRGRDPMNVQSVDASPGCIVGASTKIAVLINKNSASASEVVAACLKDRNRAVLVGERSFGKGNVQSVLPIEGGRAAIRFTTAFYYPPSGQRIHKQPKDTSSDPWGVLPSPGAEVILTEDQTARATDRIRRRSDPLRNGSMAGHPLSQNDDPNDESIMHDAQLVKAIELLGGSL